MRGSRRGHYGARAAFILTFQLLLLTFVSWRAQGAQYEQAKGHVRADSSLLGCTDNVVLVKASAGRNIVTTRGEIKLHVKVKSIHSGLVNATLVFSVSPQNAAVYKKSKVLYSKRHAQPLIAVSPGQTTLTGLAVEKGKTQRFKVKFALTECAVQQPVSVSVSLVYQGFDGATCVVAASPVQVS